MAYCFGAHMSVAGGLFLAVERARQIECDCVQLFTKNNNQWNCKPIADDEAEQFIKAVKTNRMHAPIAHTSYLLNLASPDKLLWNKSLEGLVVEWRRAEQLRLTGLVVHPGAHMAGTPELGLQNIARAIESAIDQVKPRSCCLLLENTAGQGTSLGWQFEHLQWLLDAVDRSRHVGICLDTCHAFAAGYDFSTAAGLKRMLTDLERTIGLDRLRAIHVNDSKKECGSRVDRHEHIGLGHIGEAAFSRLLRSKSIKDIPMYLETEKGIEESSGEDWDVRNLATLRRLVARR